MKNKGGSLYEVLKSASRPGGAEDTPASSPEAPASASAEGASATLQERLAAYKAAKLAAATTPTATVAVEPAPARPPAAKVVLEPDPTPVPAPARIESTALVPAAAESEETPLPAAPKGPGERVVRLTYNTALFSGMIAVGLLFIAYAVGLHVGKSQAAAEAASAPEVVRLAPRPAPAPVEAAISRPLPPPAPKSYTIRLGEWKFGTSKERLTALALADDPELKKSLERAGHRSLSKELIKRGTEERLALYVDRFSDINSDSARAALTAMKNFKFKSQTPFGQAAFEELPATR